MLPPLNNHGNGADHDQPLDLNRFRPYLQMLARLQVDEVLQAKLDDSDIVQQTLLEAHQSLPNYRGTTDQEKAVWLQRILTRNIADEIRKFRRGKRDVRLEQSLQAVVNESTMRIERWLASEEGSPSQCAMINEHLLCASCGSVEIARRSTPSN